MATLRGDLWEFLSSNTSLVGLICGDFYMVEEKEHSATGASLMQLVERIEWPELLQSNHHIHDVWSSTLNEKGYTYHSKA